MNAKDVLKSALSSTQFSLEWYLSDLSDADLLVRPAPGANHIAWQVGHLISAEPFLMRTELPDAVYPALPAGFTEQHSNDTAAMDPPKGFLKRDEYLALSKQMRNATYQVLEKLTDADLERPCTGRMAKFCPQLANLIILISNHTLMHAGQFTVVRRKLGKPVLF